MIFGIGTDLCDIRRIEATLARRGERFAEKVLGPHEIEVFRARRAAVPARGLRYLATRFSAKEAFSKAIGLGHAHADDLARLRDRQGPQRQARDRAARRARRSGAPSAA